MPAQRVCCHFYEPMQKTVSPFFGFAQLLLSGRFLRVLAAVYGLAAALLWATLLALFLGGAGKAAGQSIGPDFAAYYTAGTLFRSGESAHLYDFARQEELQRQLHLTQHKGELSAFVHPAQNAILMAPFSLLSPRAAYAIYAALMLLCFVASLAILRAISPNLSTRNGAFLLILALISSPVYFSISAGQNTGLTLLLHSAILWCLLRRRDALAGALCAVGLLKPHLFLALLPLLALGKRPRALVSFAIFAALTVALDVFIFGRDVFARNLAALQTPLYQREEILQGARMFSWQSFWELLLGNNSAATILGWSCALAVFVALCFWWKSNAEIANAENANDDKSRRSPRAGKIASQTEKSDADFKFLYAATICGTVVFAPHLPVYDLGLLLLPTLIFADRVLDFPTTRFVALRLTLLSLVVFTAFGEDFARATNFQIVVPLTTLLGFLAWKLRASENFVESNSENFIAPEFRIETSRA